LPTNKQVKKLGTQTPSAGWSTIKDQMNFQNVVMRFNHLCSLVVYFTIGMETKR